MLDNRLKVWGLVGREGSLTAADAAHEDPRWAELAGATNSLLYITPDEMSEVPQAWTAIVLPLAERRPLGHHEQRPADAAPVSFTLVAVPLSPTEQGG